MKRRTFLAWLLAPFGAGAARPDSTPVRAAIENDLRIYTARKNARYWRWKAERHTGMFKGKS